MFRKVSGHEKDEAESNLGYHMTETFVIYRSVCHLVPWNISYTGLGM